MNGVAEDHMDEHVNALALLRILHVYRYILIVLFGVRCDVDIVALLPICTVHSQSLSAALIYKILDCILLIN